MTITEIARRTDQDRTTIHAYLAGKRTPAVRQRGEPGAFNVLFDNAGELLDLAEHAAGTMTLAPTTA
ncbi:hypothetical protein [Cryobacterium sp. TMT4-31]|uniref:hypothetical protein n=1 Tax=Cryobacterium sp. TMT4-31 TaxID=1259259 RepID=UPI00106AD5A9|nr:hypothetical protein E3T19_05700 [Cryobacterium sp. TMT4-31]